MENKFMEYSMKIMPYVTLILMFYINYALFIMERPRIILTIYWLNYILFVLFSWVIIMIFISMKEGNA